MVTKELCLVAFGAFVGLGISTTVLTVFPNGTTEGAFMFVEIVHYGTILVGTFFQ